VAPPYAALSISPMTVSLSLSLPLLHPEKEEGERAQQKAARGASWVTGAKRVWKLWLCSRKRFPIRGPSSVSFLSVRCCGAVGEREGGAEGRSGGVGWGWREEEGRARFCLAPLRSACRYVMRAEAVKGRHRHQSTRNRFFNRLVAVAVRTEEGGRRGRGRERSRRRAIFFY
jgi:hypothetical protein